MKHLKLYTLLLASILIIGCSEDDPAPATPPTGSVVESITAESGNEITFTGEFADAQGLKSITLSNADLGLDKAVADLVEGASTYTLSEAFAIDAEQAPRDYGVVITVTNIRNLSETFITTITVTEPACDQEVSVFHDTFNTTDHTSTWDGYTDWDYGVTDDVHLSIAGDKLTITGDFIWWWATTATLTLVENIATPGEGTIDFGDTPIWVPTLPDEYGDCYYSDCNFYNGYDTYPDIEYHITQTDDLEASTYNNCEGVMTLVFNMEYRARGSSDELTHDAIVWTVLTINP